MNLEDLRSELYTYLIELEIRRDLYESPALCPPTGRSPVFCFADIDHIIELRKFKKAVEKTNEQIKETEDILTCIKSYIIKNEEIDGETRYIMKYEVTKEYPKGLEIQSEHADEAIRDFQEFLKKSPSKRSNS